MVEKFSKILKRKKERFSQTHREKANVLKIGNGKKKKEDNLF